MKRISTASVALLTCISLLTSCTDVCTKCKRGVDPSDYMAIIKLSHEIGSNPDEACDECILFLFDRIVDYRTSTNIRFNGASPFVNKIKALEKISGIPSGATIHSTADAVVLDKYINWAEDIKGIDLSDICLVYHDVDSSDISKTIENLDEVDWNDTHLYCSGK